MSDSHQKRMPGPFGILLRRWRHIRGISQQGLANLSLTSPRHICHLETGQARPGKELILELSASLRLPPRDVNGLMHAAGFPHYYPEDKLAAAPEMAPFRTLIASLVHGNGRIPCFVIDRSWRIQDVNRAMRVLFKALGTTYRIPDDKDIIDRVLGEDSQTSKMTNFNEVGRQFIDRLRTEVSSDGSDNEIERLIRKAENKIKLDDDKQANHLNRIPLAMCPRYKIGDEIYSAVVGISRFGAAHNVELSELRLLWLVPADQQSERVLDRLLTEESPDV